MQSVSTAYLEAINARARTIAHQVKITFVDNSILGSLITITADEGDATPAPKAAMADGYDAINEQYALADPFDETDPSDRERMYPADTLYPLPDGIIWFGDTLSDDAGAVSPSEAVVLNYTTPVNLKSVGWSGDDWLGRPMDFVVDYYKGGGWTTIATVTNHSSDSWSYEMTSVVTAIEKLRITISKVNLPQTSAKLTELWGGLILDVTDRVQSWELLKERATDGNRTSPLGNASANQVTLELDNTDDVFYQKSGSVYAPYIKANRKITLWAGISGEILPQGTFYTVQWDADQDSPTVRITARDRSKLLGEREFKSSLVYTDNTITELIETIALDAGLYANDLLLDDTTELIPYAWFSPASYWTCLKNLAESVGGVIYFNELNQLVFETIDHLTGGTSLAGLTIVEDFENAAAWSKDAGLTLSNNTTEYQTGTQSIKATTNCGGSGSQNMWTSFLSPILEIGASRIRFYCHDSNLSTLRLYIYDMTYVKTFQVNILPTNLGWNIADIPKDAWTAYDGMTWNDTPGALLIKFITTSGGDTSVSVDTFEIYGVTLDDSDNIIGMSESWQQDVMRNSVTVKSSPLAPDTAKEICSLTDVITVPAGGSVTLDLFFSESPCINVETPTVTGGAHVTISAWTAYSWGGHLVLANSAGASETVTAITVDGQPLKNIGGFRASAENALSILENNEREYTVESNYIQSYSLAQTIATAMLAALLDPGAVRPLTGRGRPELQLADRVTVVNTRMSINNDFWITRIRLTFDGGLQHELTLQEVS